MFATLCPALIFSQEGKGKKSRNKKIVVTGYVKDAAGYPLGGVQIFLDGANMNNTTNSKGYYKIRVKPDVKTIAAFSLFEGMQEVDFTGQERIDFVLGNINRKDDNELPDDALEKHTSSVDMRKASKTKYRDIYEMIKGEVPGVRVSGKSINIRSSTSINLSTEPLFVLDGVIIQDIDGIPPEIVKSIQVLKGPSAAIYGSRAANGVILIKTK